MSRTTRSRPNRLIGLFIAFSISSAFSTLIGRPGRAGDRPADLALVLDCSNSMEGQKLRVLKEGAKLAISIHDGTLSIIEFAGRGGPARTFDVSTLHEKLAAMRVIDALGIGGGTNYPAALEALNHLARGTTAIFVSDGANTNGGDDGVLRLVDQAPGRIFTVGVRAGGKAERLLHSMADRSGGVFSRVENPQALTETFIAVTQGLNHYRSYEPRETVLTFRGCAGNVFAFGYGADVAAEGRPTLPTPFLQHVAALAERVRVVRYALGVPTDVVLRAVSPDSANGRLGKILIGGLRRTRIEWRSVDGRPISGPLAADAPVRLAFAFEDPSGRPMDVVDMAAAATIVGPDGRRVDVVARPSADGTALITDELTFSTTGAVKVHARTADSSTGYEFEDELHSSHAVEKARFMGLDLDGAAAPRDLGRFAANAGVVSLGPVEIPSLDANPLVYRVLVEDPASLKAAIPTRPAEPTVTPVRGRPARVTLNARLENVPVGDYTGRIVLEPASSGLDRRFSLPFRIEVFEPLHAEPIDFGAVVPGQILARRLEIRNDGEGLRGLEVEVGRFSAAGGPVVLSAPERAMVGARGTSAISLELQVSPLCESRGRLESYVSVRRTAADAIRVPVTVDVVDPGAVSRLVVAPGELRLSAAAGAVVLFQVTVKATSAFLGADRVELDGGSFRREDGRSEPVVVAFELPRRGAIVGGGAVVAKGQLLAPVAAGAYHGEVAVSSALNGTVRVPVLLDVR